MAHFVDKIHSENCGLRGAAQVNHDSGAALINSVHVSDLLTSFIDIGLINTDSIYLSDTRSIKP